MLHMNLFYGKKNVFLTLDYKCPNFKTLENENIRTGMFDVMWY